MEIIWTSAGGSIAASFQLDISVSWPFFFCTLTRHILEKNYNCTIRSIYRKLVNLTLRRRTCHGLNKCSLKISRMCNGIFLAKHHCFVWLPLYRGSFVVDTHYWLQYTCWSNNHLLTRGCKLGPGQCWRFLWSKVSPLITLPLKTKNLWEGFEPLRLFRTELTRSLLSNPEVAWGTM